MSLTSTMFTGVSGLLNQAEALSVIGNNVSNVNTVGFKGARTLFSDTLSTSMNGNSQVGHGVQIQKVDNLFTQGSFESTGNVTDLAIQGDSFFAVKDPNVAGPVTQNNALLTRAGAFRLDSNLNLVNADGYQVLDTQGNPIKFSDNAAAIATISTALTAQCAIPAAAINAEAAAIINPSTTLATAVFGAAATALDTQATTMVTDSATFATATVAPTATAAEIAAAGTIATAATAAKTATTAAAATPTAANVSAAQAAFAALNTLVNNSTFTTPSVITDFNTFKASLTAANTANAVGAPPAEITAAIAITTAATAAQTAATTAAGTPTPATVAAAQAAFNKLTNLTNNSTFTIATVAAATFNTDVNTRNTTVNTAMATASPLITATQTQLATAQGLAFGKIDSIDNSGLITYLGKDGATLNYYNASGQVGIAANAANTVGAQRLAIVNVTNPGGLEKAGGTLFKSTVESGIPATAFSLTTNTADGGSEVIKSNNLEQSNVDMANEFVKMIMTQRAYSANSKTITTSDEMTQEVLSLKR